ncbi:MAG: glycerol-3-phosphate 1-O-acyltransferase PlsY [Holosporaceae bacterium]|jgi:glycerol-3-phosphate acyltransferase PlsY|nr:glycerol-3-phosphate 1-O-acyltransferase PlsY [Holosporaceae bacterium]
MKNLYPILAYLLGAIPFGLIFSKMFGDGKLRESGSKNIGATNAFRTQGRMIGALTLLADFLKGYLPYHFWKTECDGLNLLLFVAPIVGHIFPIWLKFKGGKGVATYFGMLGALSPTTCFGTAFIWMGIFVITKISAVASLISVASSLIILNYVRITLCLNFINQLYALIGVAVLITVKHRENIKLLIKRNDENR